MAGGDDLVAGDEDQGPQHGVHAGRHVVDEDQVLALCLEVGAEQVGIAPDLGTQRLLEEARRVGLGPLAPLVRGARHRQGGRAVAAMVQIQDLRLEPPVGQEAVSEFRRGEPHSVVPLPALFRVFNE